MEKATYAAMLKNYNKVEFENLKLLTPIEKIQGIIGKSQEPENFKESEHDANDIFIPFKLDAKKMKSVKLGKEDSSKQNDSGIERKEKVYKAGPFATFYEINEGSLQKEEEVWYYKENKEVIGPVSSYNMDKMVFFKRVDDQTRVAFRTVEKFVKLGKIKKIIEQNKGELSP